MSVRLTWCRWQPFRISCTPKLRLPCRRQSASRRTQSQCRRPDASQHLAAHSHSAAFQTPVSISPRTVTVPPHSVGLSRPSFTVRPSHIEVAASLTCIYISSVLKALPIRKYGENSTKAGDTLSSRHVSSRDVRIVCPRLKSTFRSCADCFKYTRLVSPIERKIELIYI
jgi:hypothetical protein